MNHAQKLVASLYTWCQQYLPRDDMREMGPVLLKFLWHQFFGGPAARLPSDTPALLSPGSKLSPAQVRFGVHGLRSLLGALAEVNMLLHGCMWIMPDL